MAATRSSSRPQSNGRGARGEGAELRGYKLLERIGQDELATVYRATHTTLDRPVHVYILRRTDWVTAARFQLAAKLGARILHPNLLPVIDAGHDERYGSYYVTPQVEGQSLEQLLAGGPLEPLLALRIFSQIGEALDALHREQVIHRDVQPTNIRVSSEGIAFLTNLSLAAGPETPDFSGIDEADYLTPYSAPEASLTSVGAAPSLDIYSLGAVLYQMLCGEVPPDPQRGTATLAPHKPELAEADRVLTRMLAADPGRRYGTAQQAIAALRPALRAQIDAATDDMDESRWQAWAEWLDNPLELVLGPLLNQEFLRESRARADELHRAGALRRVLNRWSRGNWVRRASLGSLMQPQQVLSYNIYFYELRAAFETRTPPEPAERPFKGGTPPLGGEVPDRWELAAPTSELFASAPPQQLTLPHAGRLLTCPSCSRGLVPCEECNGAGEIPRPRRVTVADGSTVMQDIPETCPRCRGYRTQPCPRCEGSGQLLEEQVFSFSRLAKLYENTDDLAGLPFKALYAHSSPVYEGTIDHWDARWHSVEPLRELLAEVASEARAMPAETRVIAAELSIRGAPVTEVEYLLNERPQRMLLLGGNAEDGYDIRSDRGGYDVERIALYTMLVLLALGLVLALWMLRG
jgi:eukaryotic-like serine/threonine-protein kinase